MADTTKTIMTKEQVEAWLRGNPGILEAKSQMEKHAPDLARTALALYQQLADAQAAQALVVEWAAALCASTARAAEDSGNISRETCASELYDAIRALADPSGVEALVALRERAEKAEAAEVVYRNIGADYVKAHLDERSRADTAEAERDALAEKLAAAEARVGVLTEAYWKLRSYAVHDDNCTINRHPHYRGCSCGLSKALKSGEAAALPTIMKGNEDVADKAGNSGNTGRSGCDTITGGEGSGQGSRG